MPYSAYNQNVHIDIFGAGADEMNPQDRVADDSIRSGTSLTPFVSSQLDHKTSAETPTPSKNWSTKNTSKVSARKLKQKQKTAEPLDIYNLSDLEEAQEDLENDASLNRVLKKQ